MKSLKTPLKIAITIALVVWLVKGIDWITVFGMIKNVVWPLLFLYAFFQLAGNLISAAKWQFLGRAGGFSFALLPAFFTYLAGAFINNFLPSTIGGDTYRTLWMSPKGNRQEAALIVLYDRLTGLALLTMLSLFFFITLPLATLFEKPWLIMLGAVIFSVSAVVVFGVFLAPRFLALVLVLLRAVGGSRISEFLGRLAPFTERGIYTRSLLWSLAFFVVGVGAANFILFRALGAEIGWLPFLGTIFLATLVANIPISINNIGVKEWSYVFFFGFSGVSPELAVTAALLSRVLQAIISLIGVPSFLKDRQRSGDSASSIIEPASLRSPGAEA